MKLELLINDLFNSNSKDQFISILNDIVVNKLSNDKSKFKMIKKFAILLNNKCEDLDDENIIRKNNYTIISYNKSYVFWLNEYLKFLLYKFQKQEKDIIDNQLPVYYLKQSKKQFTDNVEGIIVFLLDKIEEYDIKNIDREEYNFFENIEEVEQCLELANLEKVFKIIKDDIKVIHIKGLHKELDSVIFPAINTIVISDVRLKFTKEKVLMHEIGHLVNIKLIEGSEDIVPIGFAEDINIQISKEEIVELFCDMFAYYALKDSGLDELRPFKDLEYLENFKLDYEFIKTIINRKS